MNRKGVIYFKMVVSCGEPTEYDDIGCDGMYIESIEKTDDISQLKTIREIAKEIISDGLSVSRRKRLRDILSQGGPSG